MKLRNTIIPAALISAALALGAQSEIKPSAGTSQASTGELKYVVIISRHGVRSPTGKVDQLNQYSAEPWPKWSVPPGNLTDHGARLMTLFGAYDRTWLQSRGLFSGTACDDAASTTILADSDQRTRESGIALAAGLFPGCPVETHALAEGTHDPLFHFSPAVGESGKLIATAAISGRIGGNPAGLVDAYRPQFEQMETVLTGCVSGTPCAATNPQPKSLFDIQSSIAPGTGDHLVDLRSPLGTAATMSENLLLEYTEGMSMSQVGWGRVDEARLRGLLQLHTASSDIERRTRYIARAQSSNMLLHVLESIEQAIAHKPVAGALGKPSDRLLILVGHDTNLANISGALGLTWLVDGRLDDTPPGGALVFELRQHPNDSTYQVSAYYTAQTLNQMRDSTPLTADNPPSRAKVFIPGCSSSDADFSCSWKDFQQLISTTIDPHSW